MQKIRKYSMGHHIRQYRQNNFNIGVNTMGKVDFKAYNVTTGKDGKSYWNSLGGAFEFTTDDGRTGFNIPNMNIVVIQPKEEAQAAPPAETIEVPAEV
jgi:hypothetical protein